MDDSLTEVATRDEQTNEQPSIAGEATDEDVRDAVEGAESGGGVSLPVPSLSRKQALVLAAVALAVAALYLRRRSEGGSSSNAADARQQVRANADTERTVEVEDEESGERIELPQNPDEVTELDAAILESDVFEKVGGGGS